jgi:hypothetical protein
MSTKVEGEPLAVTPTSELNHTKLDFLSDINQVAAGS